MNLWRNFHFLSFHTNPRFPLFLLYVRCKSEVSFVRRCFGDNVQDTVILYRLPEGNFDVVPTECFWSRRFVS